jgi:hypothetical protein
MNDVSCLSTTNKNVCSVRVPDNNALVSLPDITKKQSVSHSNSDKLPGRVYVNAGLLPLKDSFKLNSVSSPLSDLDRRKSMPTSNVISIKRTNRQSLCSTNNRNKNVHSNSVSCRHFMPSNFDSEKLSFIQILYLVGILCRVILIVKLSFIQILLLANLMYQVVVI